MRYEKNLMNQWDQYALLKAERERGIEEGIEKGIEKGSEEKSFEFVKNLLASNKFSIPEIANFADVSESFVRRVKKEIK